MDSDEIAHSRELITIQKRRLHELEKQAAMLGVNCPPHITIEIEDIKQNIEVFARKIGEQPAGSFHETQEVMRQFNQEIDVIAHHLHEIIVEEKRVYRLFGIPVFTVSVIVSRTVNIVLCIMGIGLSRSVYNHITQPQPIQYDSQVVATATPGTVSSPVPNLTGTPLITKTPVVPTLTPSLAGTGSLTSTGSLTPTIPVILPPPVANPNVQAVEIGTQLQVNGWSYTYASADYVVLLGKQVGSFTAQGTYLHILIWVANNTGVDQPLPANFFALKDANNNVYPAVPQVASVAVQRGVNADVGMEDPIPANGLTTSVYLVFDVAPGAPGLTLFASGNNGQGWPLNIVP